MREQVTIVTCDGCHTEEVINSSTDEGVDYRLINLGWEITDTEDFCPVCSEEREIDDEDEK